MAVFKNVSVAFGFASGARSRESLCGTTTPCKDMTSPLTFILSTGIKEEELVHSLPVGMTTKQALASRNKRATGTNGATLSAVFICHQFKKNPAAPPRHGGLFGSISCRIPASPRATFSNLFSFLPLCHLVFSSSRPQHPPSSPPPRSH